MFQLMMAEFKEALETLCLYCQAKYDIQGGQAIVLANLSKSLASFEGPLLHYFACWKLPQSP